MKRIASILLASAVLTLSSCSNPADNARLGALTSLAVSYAENRGILSPTDAQAIRAAKTIILDPLQTETPSGSPPSSGKEPVAHLQP